MPQDHEHNQLHHFSRIGNVVDAQGKPLVVLQGARPAQDATSEALQDCRSHYQAWRSALTNAQHSAKEEADISYWVHEIAAFDRTFKALSDLVEQSAPLPDAVQWYGGVKSDDELFPPAQSVPANQQPIPKALHLEASQISAFLYAGGIQCDFDRWDGHVGFVANCAEVALDIAGFLKENDSAENPGVIAYELFEPFGKWMAEEGHLAQNSLLDEFKAQYHAWIKEGQAPIARESAS